MTAAFFPFSGPGSQAVGVGKALAEAFRLRAVFDEVDAALGEKFTAIIWDGPAETLQLTENAQPALMAVSRSRPCACWKPRRAFPWGGTRPSSPAIRSANIRRLPQPAASRSVIPRGSAHRVVLAMQKAVQVRRRCDGGTARP